MKKLTLVLALVMVTGFMMAQKIQSKDVPEAVKASFQKEFPGAKAAKWDKEESNFEASFDNNKSDQSVVFDAGGNILEIEVEIDSSELPKGVMEYVTSTYPGKKIKEVAKITDAQKIITYEVEVSGMDVIFNEQGKFIKEIKE
ncbi:MAG: PepSY-like domain-containing protein [Cyclobacteriaceae bacterium]|nr:PepSY-like domain-containing protein [Cyclobacteriaceae bacterium]